ncbi:hypothetical protein TSUD_77340 [Trifolium subterraneum]|uniref:3'-5' exonuclease domain-containing protein n=1 Tax=Trifolium subterraneum TaxID=3900 RepID=A0A2Z6M3L4_TRISU|nr:hypothetical protein TSUD_77340 [Trifolium subterraneum]
MTQRGALQRSLIISQRMTSPSVTLDIGMMSIYCSSWFSSRFLRVIDGLDCPSTVHNLLRFHRSKRTPNTSSIPLQLIDYDQVAKITTFSNLKSQKYNLAYKNITVVDRQSFVDYCNITVNLYGNKIWVIVTASASVVDEWIQATLIRGGAFHCLRKLVVALSVDPSAHTLQLCVGHRCLIFQLSQADKVPLSLRIFLLDRACKLTGFFNTDHRPKLLSSKHRLEMIIDPKDIGYIDADFDNCSMEEMIEKCLGYKVDLREEIKTSDWSVQNLSNDQVLYACVEVHCAFLVGRNLGVWLLGCP